MAFKDLREFFKPGIDLPVGDKVYHVPSPTAEQGLRLRMLFDDLDAKMSDADQMREIYQILGAEWNPATGKYEGGVWSEMIADGVSWDELMIVGGTAVINYGMSEELAEKYWASGGVVDGASTPAESEGNSKPAPPEPNRAARRAKPKKATSSKAATGSTTRGRARTAKTTPAAPTTTPKPESGTATTK